MSKYKLLEPKHFLRYGKEMTSLEFSEVTDKDLMEYTAEYHAHISDALDKDIAQVNADNNQMAELASLVYGSSSNQAKYVYRNFSKGETRVHKHYNQFPEPKWLDYQVTNARELAAEGYFADMEEENNES